MLAVALVLFISFAHAQQTDYDAVIPPVDTKSRDIAEYIVQLAWLNNPESDIAKENVAVATGEKSNARKEWMRDVQASFNINESNLQGNTDASGNVFFPRYNVGVTLNLYNILSQKGKNQIGEHRLDIANDRLKKTKLEIRAEALRRWTNFRLARQIVKERTLVEQEANNTYTIIQQLYKSDEKTLEEYTTASAAYFQAREARIRAEADLQLAKIDLEEIIGLKWEQVQHPNKED